MNQPNLPEEEDDTGDLGPSGQVAGDERCSLIQQIILKQTITKQIGSLYNFLSLRLQSLFSLMNLRGRDGEGKGQRGEGRRKKGQGR